MLPKPGQEEGPAKEASVPHRPELSSEQEAAVTLWCHPLPGTELGRCFWMPPCWLEGRGGNKETVCGTEAAALASGQAAPGLRTRRAVAAVAPSTPPGEPAIRASHSPPMCCFPGIPWVKASMALGSFCCESSSALSSGGSGSLLPLLCDLRQGSHPL